MPKAMIYYKKLKLFLLLSFIICIYVFYSTHYKPNPLYLKNNKNDIAHKNDNKIIENNIIADDIEDDKTRILNDLINDSIIPEEVIKSINYLNENHEILNYNKFGGINNISRILIIQVHNREEYLKLLINSLNNVKDINKTLIIFSHDIYYPPINKLIKDIKFCQIIQIFYPYNIQIFHDRFPGTDPNDCNEKITKNEAEKIKCNNWNNPDKYGHYRSPQLTQIKHHFWWKMNYIFDGIIDKYNLTDKNAILLEEDHIVTPDIYHVLDEIIRIRDIQCKECRMISLGLFMKNFNNYIRDIKKLGKQTWYGKHNTGMVINKSLWNEFRSYNTFFCKELDEYNWDWSLIQISYKCFDKKIVAIYPKSPRVIHIGDCGVHTHRCSSQNTANKIKLLFNRINNLFFPSEMEITEKLTRIPKTPKVNGGWGDTRDHELCLINTFPLNSTVWNFK